MQRNILLIVLVSLVLMIAACGFQARQEPIITFTVEPSQPAVHLLKPSAIASRTPTRTPMPASTNTVVPTYTPSLTPIPTNTSTPSPTPIPTKPILISYEITGGDGPGSDFIYGCLEWRSLGDSKYSFVLYEDGQLIFVKDKKLEGAMLTPEEIDYLMNKLQEFDIFNVEGTGDLREADPIYENSPEYAGDGSPYEILTVTGKRIKIYYPLKDYLVKPIKQTLELITNYHPTSSQLYKPKKLELWMSRTDPDSTLNGLNATPMPPVMEWPDSLPSLALLKRTGVEGQVYFEEAETLLIVDLFEFYPSGRIFIEQGQDYYYILACPQLP